MKARGSVENPDRTHDTAIPRKAARPAQYAKRAQAAWAGELRAHFKKLQTRHKILHTTRLPSGQIVDWIDARAQAPRRKLASPPPHEETCLEIKGRSAERPVTFELDHPEASLGPEGSVPVLRKVLRALPRGRSLQDYLSKYGRPVTTRVALNGQLIDSPGDGAGHDYGTASQTVNCFGGEGFLSAYAPYVQWSDEFSLEQILLGASNQTLEAGWQVYYNLYHDWKPHLFVFYTTNGYAKKGDDLGGYNRDVRGWVQVSRTIFPGTAIQPNSVSGGTQFALFIKYQRWAGNWWLKVGNEWVGYYPARLFTNLGLRNSADSIQFYGEVADARLPAGKTRTDMGSGRWADTRWPNAAYAHNLRYQRSRNGGMAVFDSAGGFENASGPAFYSIETHMKSAGTWGSYFWFGGPGAVPNANCQKLMRAIADAQAQIRELQDNLKTAGPTQKGGIGAQILKWRRVLEAAQEAARKNFCI